jgi:hypothetical protein
VLLQWAERERAVAMEACEVVEIAFDDLISGLERAGRRWWKCFVQYAFDSPHPGHS